MCDNVNHCADGTDESSHLCCTYFLYCIQNAHDVKMMKNYVETSFFSPLSDVEAKTILGLELTWLVLLAVSAFLVLSACFVGIAIWFCRLRTVRDENNLQC